MINKYDSGDCRSVGTPACVRACVCVSGPRCFVRDVHLSHHARRPFVSAFFPSVSSRSIVPPTRSSLLPYTGAHMRAGTHAHTRTHMRFKYTQKLCLSFHGSLPYFPPTLLAHYPLVRWFYLITCNVTCIYGARVQSLTKNGGELRQRAQSFHDFKNYLKKARVCGTLHRDDTRRIFQTFYNPFEDIK